MPQKLLFELDGIDLERTQHDIEEIRAINPHRFEFEQLSSIIAFEPDAKRIVARRHLGAEEFWVRGHIPGAPLFPGVLMLEAAAQMCSFYCGHVVPGDGFLGFGAIDKVRYRGTVRPGQTLILLGIERTLTPSRCLFDTQGIVDGKVVFEASILGIRIKAL